MIQDQDVDDAVISHHLKKWVLKILKILKIEQYHSISKQTVSL